MSATKLNMGPNRLRRKLKALGRHKAEMYRASMRGDREALHRASGEFLAVARELGMSDAEAVRAADVAGRPSRPDTSPKAHRAERVKLQFEGGEIECFDEAHDLPMIRGRKLLSSGEWLQEGEP